MTVHAAPAAPVVAPALPLARRLSAVLRIHLANPWQTLITPWIIMALIFGVNAGIWGLVAYSAGGADKVEPGAFQNNGGVTWLYVFMLVVAVQAMHFTFRFALGFSITRRDYYAGTLLYFLLLAVVYTAGLTVLAALERATGGWWLNGGFFAPMMLVDAPIAVVAYYSFAGLLLAFTVGATAAAVWVRWAAAGLYWMFGILAVALVGGLWGVTVAHAWTSVWGYLTDTPLAVLVTWTLPVTALAAMAGHLLLRRAPLRS
ncbi:ABC transporter permease [Demequina capsici]|uniref:ABC transporter permease n=1 Tax=Demequina capsici TaxID=3075620 RepID=A0AA96FGL8_9MICO|nr:MULTISPECIES: ABC transporter permease [unclassified Demequina]WNM25263.1 ABC transporter permease [Demequina sp. OYTSA14]WNM28160.1 ABC transporter permease [Demequina sp. PMTSA13]